MNIHGQSKLPTTKQLQIEDFLRYNKIDILHMQECDICEETFADCAYISSSYNLIINNSISKYGTASLIRSDLEYRNINLDTAGRIITFDIGNVTFGNIYAQSGSDGWSRSNRESFFAEVLPNLLINSQLNGCLGGDLNMIIDKCDATKNPETKMSPNFKHFAKSFNWVDSYRVLHPREVQFSRYYSGVMGEGASRIDRCYHYGDIGVIKASYHPLAFSDHHAHIVSIKLPDPFTRLACPRSPPSFRIKAEVVQDRIFHENLAQSMDSWQAVRSFGLEILPWWELLVKPGVKKLAQNRARELNRKKKEE